MGERKTKSDVQQVRGYYQETFKDWGHSVDALSWEDEQKQVLRFEILSSIIPKSSGSVLDIGCGFGDLYQFLQTHGQGAVAYTGIDLMPQFTEIARSRFPHVTFIDGDFHQLNQVYDFVLASGPFSIKVADNMQMIQGALKKMWAISSKGLAFNLLSNEVPLGERHGEYFVTIQLN